MAADPRRKMEERKREAHAICKQPRGRERGKLIVSSAMGALEALKKAVSC